MEERMLIEVMEGIYKLQYFVFLSIKRHRENTGNVVLMGAWQPCPFMEFYRRMSWCLRKTNFNITCFSVVLESAGGV